MDSSGTLAEKRAQVKAKQAAIELEIYLLTRALRDLEALSIDWIIKKAFRSEVKSKLEIFKAQLKREEQQGKD